MLQCSIKGIESGMGFPISRQRLDSLIERSKFLVIEVNKNSNLEEIKENFITEIKNYIIPVNQEYSKRPYLNKKLNNGLSCDDVIIKFLILQEMNHPDIEIGFYSDISRFMTIMDSNAKICKNKDCNNKGVHRCSGCGWAKYCCRECQKQDWKEHKLRCIT